MFFLCEFVTVFPKLFEQIRIFCVHGCFFLLFLSLGCILSGIFFLFAGTLLGGIPGFYVDRTGVHTSREAADQRRNVFQDTVELDAFDRIELDVSYVEDVSLVPVPEAVLLL